MWTVSCTRALVSRETRQRKPSRCCTRAGAGWRSTRATTLLRWPTCRSSRRRYRRRRPDPTADIDLATSDPVEVQAEQAEHDERVAQYDAMLAKAGLEPARTVDDVIGLMIRFGLVTAVGDDQQLALAADPPLPTEVLPLSDDEKQHEDSVRWHSRFGRLAQRVLQLFLAEEGGLARIRITTTIDRIAGEVDADPNSVRQAILVLIDGGDFFAERQGVAAQVERLVGHQRFDLCVDPERFAARESYQLNAVIERDDA